MDNETNPLNEGVIPDTPSEFLLDSVEVKEDAETENVLKLLQEAEEIKENKLIEEQRETISEIPVNREIYLSESFAFATAEEIFSLYMRKAKNYIKAYCKANDLVQKWIRRKKIGGVNYKYTSNYDPFVYKLILKYRENGEIKFETTTRATADEAAESLAIELGFKDSLDYKGMFKDFNEFTVAKILQEDSNYFNKIREIKKLEELKTQIATDTSASILHKQRLEWLDELDKKIFHLNGAL